MKRTIIMLLAVMLMAPTVFAYSNMTCGAVAEPSGGFRLELGVKLLTMKDVPAETVMLGGVSKRLMLFENGMSIHSATFYQKTDDVNGAQEEVILLWPNKILFLRPFAMLGGDVTKVIDDPTLFAQGLAGVGAIWQISEESVLWLGWKTGVGSERTDQFGIGLSTDL